MFTLCLMMLISTDNEKIAINIKEVSVIEDNVHETKISMSRTGLNVRVNMEYEKVLKLLKDTAAGCKQ